MRALVRLILLAAAVVFFGSWASSGSLSVARDSLVVVGVGAVIVLGLFVAWLSKK